MIKRPKPGEDEDEILRMQEEFLREKAKNDLKPAAQFVNLRQPAKRPLETGESSRKPSKYAQAKGLQNAEKKQRPSTVFGDIVEKNTESSEPSETKVEEIEDDKVYYPKIIPSVLGEIVEKNVDYNSFDYGAMPAKGFPDVSETSRLSSKMDVDDPCTSKTKPVFQNNTLNIPDKSFILASKDAEQIHKENVTVLTKMSESEILDEQKKLMSTLDPKLIEFMKLRRQNKDPKSLDTMKDEKMEEVPPTEVLQDVVNNEQLWDNDVLSHPNVDKWLHFDSLEKDKLEWMKGIEESKKKKGDEPYEARFNFKGYLMPYTIDYNEETKTLFHHGEEPNRPGYSLTELFELTRSTITQQRVMALNTIAGILDYTMAGTYNGVIEIPLSKIFFIVRIAMDENKSIILEPALQAMRNLLYNKIDEASLDALIGFEEGTQQPCLENDKSEIEELDSKESELKDYHLAEIDLVAIALRSDIIQRINYILNTVKPSYNTVQYCLQILIRIARDSIESAAHILESTHLMKTIITEFIPSKSIHSSWYSKVPVLAALKLIRILSLQNEKTSHKLVNDYNVMNPISIYISSGIDATIGLRIQTEAFCVLTNLLAFGAGLNNATCLCPIIVTTLYKHVQGTDVFVHSSLPTATHAAIVLQCINRILNSRLPNKDAFKHQVYPLIKEGVRKWMGQLSVSDSYTCGHLRLICSVLDCCKSILLIERIPAEFLDDALERLSKSNGYKELVKNLCASSNLLSSIETNDLFSIKNLKTLGGAVIESGTKVLPTLSITSPIPLLASIFQVLALIDNSKVVIPLLVPLEGYLQKIAEKIPSLCDNWFTRIETDFVFNVVRVAIKENLAENNKDLIYTVANKLCYILRADKKYELDFLFTNVIFNKFWFSAERLMSAVSLTDSEGFSQVLRSIENVKTCYRNVINLNYQDTGPNVVLTQWQEPILPRDWIYLPILNLYSLSQELDEKSKLNTSINKEFIISCSLEWILFNETCFSELLEDIDVTDRFCRIMCVYLCDNSLFLDENIKRLLHRCVQLLFNQEKKRPFNFDKQLTGLNNFQDFYTQFLEQFQSVSYGDHSFAACVLAPLAQKHNVKWRKLLWSEYAGCLRALDCPENMLCYELNDYLYPEESDESLIKSYFQALNGNLLRNGTLAHKIASHHTSMYKNRNSTASA